MSWKIAPIGRGGDLLYSQAGTPSLDLRFAEKKALTDYISGDNLVTFTRASSGTYVDGDGLIKTTPVNLLTYSEEFDNNSWAKFNSTVNANTASAPSGETTADALIENTATSSHSISMLISASSGTTYTFTVHAKANERSHIDLSISGVVTIGCTVRFTLSGSGTSTLRQGSPTPTHSITALSGGWYRCQLTFTTTSAGSAQAAILVAPDASSSAFYTGDGVSGVYIWGAQLETGSTATDYIPTTSSPGGAPRFDHDPTTGESLGLLVEEARTNLVTASSDIAGYFTNQNSTATADASTALDGTTTADLIVPNTTLDTHASYNSSLSLTSNTTYSYSIFVKPNGYNWLQLLFTSGFKNSTVWVNFNLTGAGSFGFTGGGELSKSIQVYPNGWYRCTITATSGSSVSTGGPAYLVLDSDRNSRDANYAGNNTSGIYIWGAQLELGSFPTSYIPTIGAQATRAADVTSITGTNFSSWYNQSGGTVFTQYIVANVSTPYSLQFDDTTASNAFIFINNSNNVNIKTSSVLQYDISYPVPSRGDTKSIATAIATNNARTAIDGTLYSLDTSVSLPTVTQFRRIGNTVGHISRLTYWPQRLPDTTLQTITT